MLSSKLSPARDRSPDQLSEIGSAGLRRRISKRSRPKDNQPLRRFAKDWNKPSTQMQTSADILNLTPALELQR